MKDELSRRLLIGKGHYGRMETHVKAQWPDKVGNRNTTGWLESRKNGGRCLVRGHAT